MVPQIKKRLYNLSLKYKIVMVCLVVTLIPLFVLTVVAMSIYDKNNEERAKKHIEENILVIADRLDRVFSDIEHCSNYLTINLNSVMANTNDIRQQDMILRELNNAQAIFQDIEAIVYVLEQGKLYTTHYSLLAHEEEIINAYPIQSLRRTTGKTVLFNLEETYMQFTKPMDEDRITFGKKVIHITSGKTLGYLLISVRGKGIDKYISQSSSQYFLVDNKGQYVQGIGDAAFVPKLLEWQSQDESNQHIKYKGNKYLVSEKTIAAWNWKVIGITSMDDFNISLGEILAIWFSAFSIIGGLLIIAISLFKRIITDPLLELKEGAEAIASGDLSRRYQVLKEDEIGKLGQIFNYMTEEISGLLKKVDYEARKKREYELSLIHQQVKPHFLYNTLDIIIMLSEMNKNREAQRVTKKLADYYKNSLSNSEEIISLEKEIRIVEDYLELQLIRYGDCFTYTLDIAYETKEVCIPKMTLQPLIENAIYHGLKYKEGWGNITIRSVDDGEFILIYVIDDGIGMNEETLSQMSQLKKKPHNHFGVYSVDHRLKLFYGEDFGLQVQSKIGQGTTILIRLPKTKVIDS